MLGERNGGEVRWGRGGGKDSFKDHPTASSFKLNLHPYHHASLAVTQDSRCKSLETALLRLGISRLCVTKDDTVPDTCMIRKVSLSNCCAKSSTHFVPAPNITRNGCLPYLVYRVCNVTPS